jgi:hypothetical protein
MQLTKYSRNKILETFNKWRVDKEFADPMYNYLVFGFSPGSCFTSVLANDFFGAMTRSHPANTVEAFKALAKWIADTVPSEARGSYKAVEDWTRLTAEQRRVILEKYGVVLPEDQEVWLTLNDTPTQEPYLY